MRDTSARFGPGTFSCKDLGLDGESLGVETLDDGPTVHQRVDEPSLRDFERLT
jgi:hypothetical protein